MSNEMSMVAPPPRVIRRPAVASREASSGGGLTGRDILRILRRRKWIIILSIMICSVLTFSGTLLWRLFAPLYTATAYIRVEVPKGTALGVDRGMAPTDIMERLLMTQARLVKSQAILSAAVKDTAITKTYWYRKNKKDPEKELDEELVVRPFPNTDFIQVSLTDFCANDKEKKQLADVVNAVAVAAEANMHNVAVAGYRREASRLDRERTTLSRNLERVRSKIGTGVDELGGNLQVVQIEHRTWAQEKGMLEMDVKEAQGLLDEVNKQSPEELANAPEISGMVNSDRSLQMLQQEEMNLSLYCDGLTQGGRIGLEHSSFKDAQIRLQNIRQQVSVKTAQLTQQAMMAYRNMLEMDVNSKTKRLKEIMRLYMETSARLRDLQRKLEERGQEAADAKVLLDRIAQIERRQLDLNLLQGGQRVYVARTAEVPREPSHPKWGLMIPLGVFVGILIGFGITFLLEFIDTSIKTPSELTRRMDLPLLGMIPHTDDLDEEIKDLRLAFMTSPNSLISEAFRQIRTCLLFSGPAENQRSLLITSPLPGDGRGTVAMNLAASMARGGRRILVVDANFRQPMVERLFPGCPSGGLSSALVGRGEWRDAVYEIEPNLCVLGAGPMPPNPAELLGSAQMGRLMREMTEEYDHVFFDTAPSLIVTDSAVLATMVDGVVLVVRAGVNTFGVVQKTKDILTRVGAHLIGVVLNSVRVTAGGYLRKNYDTFYAYHEQLEVIEGNKEE